ncbi:hypothetical protein CYMTET_34178 [Cymbomonas tetramitiformis]|uniref:DUF1736 domain-containing protein n=1 Tax=Cymbomonas tetramitiformis TaxID=36881 RepID=A0AAE0KQG7_9CHLO|nr:hypothetical protein CYMTET_34178 [Cymbomonas tetramitiformis]
MWFYNKKIAPIVVLVAAVATYSDWEALNGQFLLDDKGTVTDNPTVRPEAPWWLLWQRDYWGKDDIGSRQSHKSYRPITNLTFRWNYLYNELDTFGYHVVNVAIHVFASILCYYVVDASILQNDPEYSFFAAFLFAVHPIHAEAVANITGRAEVLCALFYFLGFLCYSSSFSRSSINGVKVWRARSVWMQSMAITCTLLLAVLSMLSKEQGITLPVLCAVWDFVMASRLVPSDLVTAWQCAHLDRRRRLRGWLVRTAVMGVLTVAIALARLSLNGGHSLPSPSSRALLFE